MCIRSVWPFRQLIGARLRPHTSSRSCYPLQLHAHCACARFMVRFKVASFSFFTLLSSPVVCQTHASASSCPCHSFQSLVDTFIHSQTHSLTRQLDLSFTSKNANLNSRKAQTSSNSTFPISFEPQDAFNRSTRGLRVFGFCGSSCPPTRAAPRSSFRCLAGGTLGTSNFALKWRLRRRLWFWLCPRVLLLAVWLLWNGPGLLRSWMPVWCVLRGSIWFCPVTRCQCDGLVFNACVFCASRGGQP